MIIENSRFISHDGVSSVSCMLYLPDGPIKGVVQLVHGMAEHKERYTDFMAYLAQNGFACCIHDHLGHGSTMKNEEDRGYFGEPSGWRNLVMDTVRFCQLTQSRTELKGKPYFLFGHSMGSFVARLASVELGEVLDGAVYCGTCGENKAAPLAVKIVDGIIRRQGSHVRPKLIDTLMFGSYNKHFGPVYTGKEWLSRNLAVGRVYVEDPLCGFCFTAAGFKDLLRLIIECNTAGWYAALDDSLPVLLIAGDMDPVGDYGKSVVQVTRRLRGAGSADVTLKLYPGARHELLNEINNREVYADLLNWLQNHLPA